MVKFWIGAAAAAMIVAGAGSALGQQTVKIANLVEISGPGAVVGSNWKNAIDLAVSEINAKGGLLGRKIEVTHYDTQTNPGIARAQAQKALDTDPYVLFGPVYSGSAIVTQTLAKQHEIAEFTGGEAASLTQQNNPYIFRTSFGQHLSMPKIANYMRDVVKAKRVALLWCNDDFGKGGRDTFIKEAKARGIEVVADLSSENGQADFAADVVKAKASNPDALFIYLHEEENARLLREIRKQGITVPLIGETTLLNQKVIELAGDAANGVKGHVGLSADAPIPAIQDFRKRYEERFKSIPDHNAIKAYLGVYAMKHVTEKVGKFDRKAFALAMRGARISVKDEPGVLMDVVWDKNGDVDRISFLAEVVNGQQKITETLPPLGM
jgi:branched-chain amino acid transport system substrate-binding protein